MVSIGPISRSFDLLGWTDPSTADAFVAVATTRRVPQGGIIYQQGDPGTEMFRIVEGSVRVSVSRADGREIIFLFFGKGDCFGISSLIDGEPLPQTAEAVAPTVLQAVGAASFTRLRERHRDFDSALLKLLSLQMRVVSAHFIEASLSDLTSRVGARLIEYAQGSSEATRIVRMSQTELAASVGASRQSVNRVLQRLQNEGLIAIDYSSIAIPDLGSLRTFVFERGDAKDDLSHM